MPWTVYDFERYLLSAPTKERKRIDHNIGITFNVDGMGICHSVWHEDVLVATHLWTAGKENDLIPLSVACLMEELMNIFEKWDTEAHHNVNLWCGNESILLEVLHQLNEKKLPYNITHNTPAVRPHDAPAYLLSLLGDGRLALASGIDRELVNQAVLEIAENETGRPIGLPEGLALMFGCAEPMRRKSADDSRVSDAVRSISALVG